MAKTRKIQPNRNDADNNNTRKSTNKTESENTDSDRTREMKMGYANKYIETVEVFCRITLFFGTTYWITELLNKNNIKVENWWWFGLIGIIWVILPIIREGIRK